MCDGSGASRTVYESWIHKHEIAVLDAVSGCMLRKASEYTHHAHRADFAMLMYGFAVQDCKFLYYCNFVSSIS